MQLRWRTFIFSYQCLQAFPLRKSIFSLKKSKVEKYEALRGISFGVKKGEIVGVIGRNGSGKSTLLKAIAGIFAPDQEQSHLQPHLFRFYLLE